MAFMSASVSLLREIREGYENIPVLLVNVPHPVTMPILNNATKKYLNAILPVCLIYFDYSNSAFSLQRLFRNKLQQFTASFIRQQIKRSVRILLNITDTCHAPGKIQASSNGFDLESGSATGRMVLKSTGTQKNSRHDASTE